MAQLDSLPPELLRNILSFISFPDRHRLAMRRSHAVNTEPSPFYPLKIINRDCNPFDQLKAEAIKKRMIAQCTLRNLCLASKKFRTLAEPFLYSSWRPCEETDHLSVYGCWTDRQNNCLRQFLRTLIGRVDLAYHVRYIELENWEIDCGLDEAWKEDGFGSFIDSENTELFFDAAKKARIPSDSGWLSAIARGSPDALVALLLTQVHNIEGLSFMLPYGSRYPKQIVAHAAFESVPPPMYSFPRLSHISYYASYDIGGNHFDSISLSIYFFLPAMRVIEGWQCVDSEYMRGWYGGGQKTLLLPQKKSKVTSIELSNSEVDQPSIERIVSACEALESFTLSSHSFGGVEESVAYSKVCCALQSAQCSLKQLRLDTGARSFVEGALAPLPPFNKFLALASLNLELDMLLGNQPASAPRLVDVLPTSIESLTLRYRQSEGWDWSLAPHLWSLVQCSKESFPRLNRVELIRFSMPDMARGSVDIEDVNSSGVSALGSAFQEAAINFSYRSL